MCGGGGVSLLRPVLAVLGNTYVSETKRYTHEAQEMTAANLQQRRSKSPFNLVNKLLGSFYYNQRVKNAFWR